MGFCSEAAAPTAPPRRAGPWIRTQGTWFCSMVVLTDCRAESTSLGVTPPTPRPGGPTSTKGAGRL